MNDQRLGEVISKVGTYYTEKVREHGATHRGVDWNSSESQFLRFDQLLKICPTSKPFTLLDFGCGYGALAPYVQERYPNCSYRGFDVSEAMITQARSTLGPDSERRAFVTDLADLPIADVTVASGIFSVKLDTPTDLWEKYISATLDRLCTVSSDGFAFNMLTGFSEPAKMRPDLYYADPTFFFTHCRRYSNFVALLHDYPIYEFTILVRKQ